MKTQNCPQQYRTWMPQVALVLVIGMYGCAGEFGANRNTSEAKVAGPATAPRIWQVAVAENLVGRQGSDVDALAGRSVAVGDFNGDGFGDIAAGIPGANGGRGAVAIIYGDAQGMDLDNPDLFTRARITEDAVAGFGQDREGDQFGYSVAAGDFDGDGLTDLVIGAPFRSVNGQPAAGEVFYVMGHLGKGPAALLIRHGSFTQTGAGVNERNDHFGFSLAVGDFNGDGRHDVAIGAPDEDDESTGHVDSGAVFIRYGGQSGLSSYGFHHVTAAMRNPMASRNAVTADMNSTETGERFGFALAAAELHTNPNRYYDDLLVGAPGKDVRVVSGSSGLLRYDDAGKVYLFDGQVSQRQLLHRLDIVPSMAPIGIVGFGSSLAAGDFDHDGHVDVAVGAPDADYTYVSSGGRVFTAMYNALDNRLGQRALPDQRGTEWYREASQMLTQEPIAKIEDGDQFGFSLAAADFNQDGFADLAVGSPGEDWGPRDTGLVFLFLGSAGGLRQTYGCAYHFMDQAPRGANEAGDRFGYALAAGVYRRLNGTELTVNGDVFPDLVIGTPYENRPDTRDAGAIFLARTTTVSGGPFDGVWTGTINGDRGSATVTVSLCDKDGLVSGSASLDDNVTFIRCTDGLIGALTGGGRVTLGRSADVNAFKANAASTHMAGSLVNLQLPANVRARTGIVADIVADGTLHATITVSDVRVDGIDPGDCADLTINVILTRIE